MALLCNDIQIMEIQEVFMIVQWFCAESYICSKAMDKYEESFLITSIYKIWYKVGLTCPRHPLYQKVVICSKSLQYSPTLTQVQRLQDWTSRTHDARSKSFHKRGAFPGNTHTCRYSITQLLNEYILLFSSKIKQ